MKITNVSYTAANFNNYMYKGNEDRHCNEKFYILQLMTSITIYTKSNENRHYDKISFT